MHYPTKERREQATPLIQSATLPSASDRSSSSSRLSDRHYRHCCGHDRDNKERGLDPDWIAANCYSVDEKEATGLLGYRAKSGGIVIHGGNGQYQFRPDRPWGDRQGKKAPKYRTALGDEYDALLPAHPFEKNYWHDLKALKALCWQIDGLPYLLITEGGFKAIAACFHELPCIALLGVEMGLTPAAADPQGKRYLVSALERLARAGFGFILGFDADIATKEAVKVALYKLGCQLQKFDVPVRVLPAWDEQLGKGIDDYIQMNDIERFRELLTKSIAFETWIERQRESGDRPKLSPLQRAWATVLKEYGDRLRFNELTLSVELDGEAVELDDFYLDLELVHNCSIAKDKAHDLAVRCAKQNPYHPVRDYLNRVAETVTPIDIRSLSGRYFGTLDPVYNEMMYRHLIGSVARIFNPGCKKDEAVILKGKQGVLKSTFWKTLYGEEFFSDSLKGTERDDLLVLHQYWALELAEFETITSKKQAGDLKAFLSASIDTFRSPYARCTRARKRQSVIVGSVNPDAFLVDETGNRRYWVIPVTIDQIDRSIVARERDAIWAAAVLAYRAGEGWHLSYEREREISDLNGNYCHADSWEVPLSNYLEGRSMVTVYELLTSALDFDTARISKRDEMRVASVLRSLGWQKTLATYLGKRQKVWVKDDPPQSDPPPFHPFPREVDHPSKLDISSLTAIGDPPDPPKNQTFIENSFQLPLAGEEVSEGEQKLETEVDRGSGQAKTVTAKGFEPIDLPRRQSSPDRSLAEVDRGGSDYSTYPHRTSNDIRAKEKRALICKEGMLACTNKEELARFKSEGGFSEAEIKWVYRHALTPAQREKVKGAADCNQLNLLEQPAIEWDELMAAIDAELARSGWTVEVARDHLARTYGVKSRHQLSDEQVIEFWEYLKGR
jgi:predicted P-loop ATPase